jgi:hypothetical protein
MSSPIQPLGLAVQTPQPTPLLQSVGDLMKLRGGLSDIALKQAEVKRANAEAANQQVQADQKRRTIQDQNTFMEAIKDPAVHSRIMQGDTSDVDGKMLPGNLEPIMTPILNHAKDVQALTEGQKKIQSTAFGTLASGANGLLSLTGSDGKPDLEAINAQLPTLYQHWQNNGVLKDAGVDVSKLPTSITSVDQIHQFLAGVGAEKDLRDQQLAQRETAAKATEAEGKGTQAVAEAGLADAKRPGAAAESGIQQLQFAAMKSQKAEDWDKVIDQIAPSSPTKDGSPDANTSTKALVRSAIAAGAKPETIQAIVGDASKKVQSDRAAMDLMVKEQPYKLQQSVAQAVATARAMQGSGPTAGVPPAMQREATDQFEKSGMTYANALSASDEMKTFIDLARSGNKVAYAYAPTTGVLTINSANGTKRVNMAEINQYAGAGSDWDKVQQFFGKHLTGESIDPSVLSDMEKTHAALADVAGRKHAMEVSAIDQATGATFQPMKLRTAKPAATIRARDPQGNLHEAPTGTPLPAGWKAENQ